MCGWMYGGGYGCMHTYTHRAPEREGEREGELRTIACPTSPGPLPRRLQPPHQAPETSNRVARLARRMDVEAGMYAILGTPRSFLRKLIQNHTARKSIWYAKNSMA